MKTLNIFIVLLLSVSAAAQVTLAGIVKDATNNEPVPYASVAIKGTSYGTVTNEEGAFRIAASKPGIIVITSIGYISKELSSNMLDKDRTVLLDQDNIQLEEVTITNVPLNELLRSLISTSISRFEKKAMVNTYYREFVKDNDKITRFSDGLLDYYIDNTGRKLKSNLVVKQNRCVQLFTEQDEEILKDFDSEINVQQGVMAGYFGRLYGSIVKRRSNYEFHLKSNSEEAGSDLMVISFEPKSGIEEPLYQGSVTYDPTTGLIYRVEMEYAPSHAQYAFKFNLLGMHYDVMDEKYRADYKMIDDKYSLSYIRSSEAIRFWMKKGKFDETLEYKSDLVVISLDTRNVTFDKQQLYKKKQLSDKPTNYSEKFWQQNNAIVLTQKEEDVIKKLKMQTADNQKP